MVVIEPARSEDLESLVDLLGSLFVLESEMRPDAAKQRAGLEAILAQPSSGMIFVAHQREAGGSASGPVVGMISVLYTISTMLGGPAGIVEDFIVNPENRGQGVGRLLMDRVFSHARERGLLRLALQTDQDNFDAQRLYRSYGFEPSSMLLMRCYL